MSKEPKKSYIGAPYNFVPFADRVYNPVSKEHMEDHDKIYSVEKVSTDIKGKERYTGEISYTITAESPIMIGDGIKHDDETEFFFKNENGKYAIPGSTMRGLIRENVQILGASSVRRDIDDYRLMYRHVAFGALKDEYGERLGSGTVSYPIPGKDKEASISILKKVKAGYIKCNDDGKYEISPTQVPRIAPEMPNYYVLSERKISSAWEKYAAGQAGETFAYDLFVKESKCDGHPKCEKTILMHYPDQPFQMSINPRGQQESIGNKESGREIWYIRGDKKKDGYEYYLSWTRPKGYVSGKLVTCNNGGKTITELKDDLGNTLCVGDIHYKGKPNLRYVPYSRPCSYKVSKTDPKDIEAVSMPQKADMEGADLEGWKRGWAVSTGRMNEKKAIYIIPDMDSSQSFLLDSTDIKSFQIDYNKRENTLKSLFDKAAEGSTKEEKNEDKKRKARKCFGLPQQGEDEKPVFYIELDGAASTYYISFTPHLRLFFDHTVAEGIQEEPLSNGYDLATSIFGLSEENGKLHYKSKVSFTDAELTLPVDSQSSAEGKKQTFILAEPKPTSYLDYLVQSEQLSTYSSESFKLRGLKQYWLRKEIYSGNVNKENDNVGSRFIPLKNTASFAGKVRFQNLSGEELGLLLWSIRLEPGCKMNVGKGKPYGFGVIRVSDIKTRILNTEKAYNTDELALDPLMLISEEKGNELIDEYKKTVIGGKKVADMESVKAFLRMKSVMPNPERIRYMSIDKKEYQSRERRLHTVDEVLDKGPDFEPPVVKAARSKAKGNSAGGRANQGGGGNHGGTKKEPALRPIDKGSNIVVIIDEVGPNSNKPGELTATFTKWHRLEPGHEEEIFTIPKSRVFKVSSDKKVGDEVRIRINKVEKEMTSKTITKILGDQV